jgi:ComF family protein
VERCPQCRRRAGAPLLKVRAAALHTHPLREAIHALKYDGRTGLAPLLARYLVAAYADPLWRTLPRPIDAVTPVPLHAARLAERGYNQSSLLAAAFCAATGLPLQTGWLARSRETRPQVGLGPAERQINVDGAFAADPAVAGKVILLIDDVLTTGATLAACASAADAQGAFAVYGLTLAQPAPRLPAHPADVWWEGDF